MREEILIDQYISENYFEDRDTLALIDGNRTANYAEFIASYTELGAYLANSVIIENGIVLFMEKSIEAAIGMFGILNAGSYYIPVDVTSPEDRLNYIIDASGAKTILVSKECGDKLASLQTNSSLTVIEVDFTTEKQLNLRIINKGISPKGDVSPRTKNDPAYVIFTSGSTGLPKAVMITHENLSAFLDSCDATIIFSQTSQIRYLAICPWYFDGSISDIFCTVKDKGTLILIKRLGNPFILPQYIEKYKITHTLMLSSVLKIFGNEFSQLNKHDLSSLKVLWYGGEPCPVSFIKRVKEAIPDVMFVHGYGPTELTHTSTWLIYNEIPESDTPYLQIGKPLKNIVHYVISPDGKIINEPNQIGELYLGGKQLMKGYYGDSKRTSDYIIEFPENSGQRIYKSGDHVFYNDDFDLIFHGRNDDLIKHNGYLVSLIEIENRALELENVSDAIAVFQKNEQYSTIVLGVLAKESYQPKAEQIRLTLSDKLPAYMLPNKIILFENNDITYTSNGKLDKKQLKEHLLKQI